MYNITIHKFTIHHLNKIRKKTKMVKFVISISLLFNLLHMKKFCEIYHDLRRN